MSGTAIYSIYKLGKLHYTKVNLLLINQEVDWNYKGNQSPDPKRAFCLSGIMGK